MKGITAISLILFASLSMFAQSGPPAALAAPADFRGENVIVDGAGNLIVSDFGHSSTGVTVTGLRHSFFAPQTRITIQTPGTTGNIQTVTYDAGIQVIGAGSSAIYAIVTLYTVSGTTVTTAQSLIAIKPGQALPAALSGFPSLPLTSPTQARLGTSDYLALLTESVPAAGSSAVRTARVVHFNGNSFDVTSSAALP